jgi:hypothetical protein
MRIVRSVALRGGRSRTIRLVNAPLYRTPVQKSATVTACGVILWALAGCDSTGPTEATSEQRVETFCAAYTTLPGRPSVVASVRAWDKRFAEIDPPDDMPDVARTGMRLQAEMATRVIPAPSTRDESLALDEFHAFATDLCGSPPMTLEAG